MFSTWMYGVWCFSDTAASGNSNEEDEDTHKHEPLVQLGRVKARPIPHRHSVPVPPRNPDDRLNQTNPKPRLQSRHGEEIALTRYSEALLDNKNSDM